MDFKTLDDAYASGYHKIYDFTGEIDRLYSNLKTAEYDWRINWHRTDASGSNSKGYSYDMSIEFEFSGLNWYDVIPEHLKDFCKKNFNLNIDFYVMKIPTTIHSHDVWFSQEKNKMGGYPSFRAMWHIDDLQKLLESEYVRPAMDMIKVRKSERTEYRNSELLRKFGHITD